MNKLTVFFTVLVMIFANSAFADSPTPKEGKSKTHPHCANMEAEVNDDLLNLGECFSDNECGYRYFSCPFRRWACEPHFVGTQEVDSILEVERKISEFKDYCINPDEKRKELCAKSDTEHFSKSCPNFGKLLCVNGKCVTQTHIMMRNGGEGKDVYGSIGILKPRQATETKGEKE